MAPVTGIASGGVGTAANLEDTQLWSLEDLRAPGSELAFEPEPAPAPVRVWPAAAMAAAAPQPAMAEHVEPGARVAASPVPRLGPAPVLEPVRARRVATRGRRRRTGILAAAAVGVLALATMLAMRDGLPGGATRGASDPASPFPSQALISTAAPAATAAPDVGGGGNGKDKGGGNGKDKTHGGDKKP